MTLQNVKYINETGGIPHYKELAIARSKMLYDTLDNSDGYYIQKTDPQYRSRINVVFRIKDQ